MLTLQHDTLVVAFWSNFIIYTVKISLAPPFHYYSQILAQYSFLRWISNRNSITSETKRICYVISLIKYEDFCPFLGIHCFTSEVIYQNVILRSSSLSHISKEYPNAHKNRKKGEAAFYFVHHLVSRRIHLTFFLLLSRLKT